MDQLKEFIQKISRDVPTNCLKIYFSRKTASKYISHEPSVSETVQSEITKMVLPYINSQLNCNRIVDYNPIGVVDGEVESMKQEDIPLIEAFFNSLTNENIYTEMSSLKVDKIAFYCIEIAYEGKKLYLLRQFQKYVKLRKGLLMQIINDELSAMENNFLGLDDTVDIILFDGKIFLLNHISLERIFEYKDEFLKKTNEALGEILSKNIISNIEQFAEDCCRDIRITKKFTNIMSKGRLPLFFDNYDKVPEIVSELELDIEFDENRKLIYRERSQLFHIINLLSDSYFKTLLANRPGIAKLEEDIHK